MNKYDYLWIVQGIYGSQWEDLTAGTWREAMENLWDYRNNETGLFRLIQRRVLKQLETKSELIEIRKVEK
jgi:hypothetical protein